MAQVLSSKSILRQTRQTEISNCSQRNLKDNFMILQVYRALCWARLATPGTPGLHRELQAVIYCCSSINHVLEELFPIKMLPFSSAWVVLVGSPSLDRCNKYFCCGQAEFLQLLVNCSGQDWAALAWRREYLDVNANKKWSDQLRFSSARLGQLYLLIRSLSLSRNSMHLQGKEWMCTVGFTMQKGVVLQRNKKYCSSVSLTFNKRNRKCYRSGQQPS